MRANCGHLTWTSSFYLIFMNWIVSAILPTFITNISCSQTILIDNFNCAVRFLSSQISEWNKSDDRMWSVEDAICSGALYEYHGRWYQQSYQHVGRICWELECKDKYNNDSHSVILFIPFWHLRREKSNRTIEVIDENRLWERRMSTEGSEYCRNNSIHEYQMISLPLEGWCNYSWRMI